MKLETFFDNFEVLAEAPNGVQKLREMILELAMRGKLVAQDEKDETAAVLLKRIKIERDRLIKERKIKNTEPLPPIESNEMQYSIPKSWQWVHLGEIGQVVGGGTPDTKNLDYFTEKGISWLTPADLYGLKHKYIGRGRRDLTERGLKESSAQLMPGGTVLFSSRAPIGYVAIAKNDLATNQGFKSLIPFIIEMNEYIYYFLKKAGKEIDESASGTTFKEIPGKDFIKVQIPLPPLAEQRRIVTKVDQLMSLCDELEARQQKKRESHAHINTAALDRLLSARAPGEFVEGWRRISDNFDLLYDAPENVGALRQVILQLAIMGKLVAQDEKDEPASVLLEQINKEKERVVNEGRIKIIKTPPIKNDELAFELPKNWEGTRLGNIAIKLGAGSTPLGGRSVYDKTGIKFIRSQNVWNDGLRLEDIACISTAIHQQMSGTIVKPGDILLNITGASIGRSAIVPDDFDEGNVSQHVAIVRLVDKKIRRYLHICLISPYIQNSIMGVQVGISREGLSMKNLQDFIIPIPPLEEQLRIVARVDQLMSLCDKLEAGLMRSQADSERLMESVVGRMLAGESK